MSLDPGELADLIEFLRDCPGRISAAVVHGAEAADELIARARAEFDPAKLSGSQRLFVERVRPDLPDLEDYLAGLPRGDRLGAGDHWLVLVAVGPGASGAADRVWQRLNHLREFLAGGRLRTCLVVDPENEPRIAQFAGALWDWARIFRFAAPPSATTGTGSVAERAKVYAAPGLPAVEALAAGGALLATLREHLARAKRTRLATTSVARDYCWPLFEALLEAGAVDEARTVWEVELGGGAALSEPLRLEGARLLADATVATVSWLHLSDLQCRADSSPECRALEDALLAEIEALAGSVGGRRGDQRLAPDFIAITGDIAYSGDVREYEMAEGFLIRLAERAGVPRERIYPVPGNHDVDRTRDAPEFMRRALRGRRALEEFWRDPVWRAGLFGGKLANYRAFARRLNPTLVLPDDQPGGFQVRLDVGGMTVTLLGLSTCWLGNGSAEDRGHLLIGREQVRDLADPEPGAVGEARVAIGLAHHPLDWLQDFDRDEIETLLAPSLDLLLHGHAREAGLRVAPAARATLSTLALGGDAERPTRLSLVRIALDERRGIRIWPRVHDPAARAFVVDRDAYADARDGAVVRELRPAPSAPREATARRVSSDRLIRAYLERVIEEHRYLDIRGMGGKVVEKMELRDVYTRLRVAAPYEERRLGDERTKRGRRAAGDIDPEGKVGAAGETDPLPEDENAGHRGLDPDGRQSDIELRDVLGKYPHLVLVGDPGSGKTTFLRFTALNLARALLDPAARDDAMRRLGLTGEPPCPVFIRLGSFGDFLSRHPDDSTESYSPDHFHRYLDHLAASYHPGSGDFLRSLVVSGGCILLLDGLDEVPGERLGADQAPKDVPMRERVGRIIEHVAIAGKRAGNRHVVTARTRAYQDRVQLAADFTRCMLVDFGPSEIEEFVAHWSRALHRIAPGSAGTAESERYAADLLEAIRAHPSVGPMTGNPLLLTVLAVVHWDRHKLPEQRAELYEAAVDFLLRTRERLSPYPDTLRKECLQTIALRMVEDPKGVRRTLGRAEAAAAVRPLLGVDLERAIEFVEDEELYSGILVSRIEGEVEFWHLTFQEYLAADGLAFRADWWPRISPHLAEDQWSEIILLLAGCRRREGVALAAELIEKILAREPGLPGRARAVGLVGRILRDILPYGGDPAAGTGYEKALRETLAIFEPGPQPVPERLRIEVGEALGQAGDPRLAEGEPDMVLIRGGSFLMGAERGGPKGDRKASNEQAARRVTLSDFWIDRYPVTVERFWRFVEKGERGYLDPRVWDPRGWAWRERLKRTGPGEWTEQLRHPNRPVTRVAWYEADAYARWLGKGLPTEAQWEYAARGKEGRLYPWGDQDPTEHHANFDGRVGAPTPVGIYPLGATPENVRDLAGNVWEWCADWYSPYPDRDEVDPPGPDKGEGRVLRGGSFGSGPVYLRGALRVGAHSGFEDDDDGFRCVRRAAGGQGR